MTAKDEGSVIIRQRTNCRSCTWLLKVSSQMVCIEQAEFLAHRPTTYRLDLLADCALCLEIHVVYHPHLHQSTIKTSIAVQQVPTI